MLVGVVLAVVAVVGGGWVVVLFPEEGVSWLGGRVGSRGNGQGMGGQRTAFSSSLCDLFISLFLYFMAYP